MKDSNLRNGGFRVHCLTAWLIRKDKYYYIIKKIIWNKNFSLSSHFKVTIKIWQNY